MWMRLVKQRNMWNWLFWALWCISSKSAICEEKHVNKIFDRMYDRNSRKKYWHRYLKAICERYNHACDHWLIDVDCLGFYFLQPYNRSESESDVCGWDVWKRYSTSMWKKYVTEICEGNVSKKYVKEILVCYRDMWKIHVKDIITVYHYIKEIREWLLKEILEVRKIKGSVWTTKKLE